jgi:hypothetical protein
MLTHEGFLPPSPNEGLTGFIIDTTGPNLKQERYDVSEMRFLGYTEAATLLNKGRNT